MRIMYFNDTRETKAVYNNDLSNYAGSVKPQSFITFDVDIPEGYGVFFKEWNTNIVLISNYFIAQENLDIDKDLLQDNDCRKCGLYYTTLKCTPDKCNYFSRKGR
jgi:hypothetical protein